MNVPVHHLIVVDRNSDDGTLDTVKRIFPDTIVTYSSENLGRARRTGIGLVDTPYFAFVDDDVEIPPGWFERLTSRLNDSIGGIHELDYMVDLPEEVEKWDGSIRHSLAVRTATLTGNFVDVTPNNQNSVRGLTHNTLVMTDLLKDWKPTPLTSAFEDWLIMKHIVGKGYKWRMIMDRTIRHHFTGGAAQWCRKAAWNLVGERVTGFNRAGLKWFLAEGLREVPKALTASIKFHDSRILRYVIRLNVCYVDCYVRWPKYLLPKR